MTAKKMRARRIREIRKTTGLPLPQAAKLSQALSRTSVDVAQLLDALVKQGFCQIIGRQPGETCIDHGPTAWDTMFVATRKGCWQLTATCCGYELPEKTEVADRHFLSKCMMSV